MLLDLTLLILNLPHNTAGNKKLSYLQKALSGNSEILSKRHSHDGGRLLPIFFFKACPPAALGIALVASLIAVSGPLVLFHQIVPYLGRVLEMQNRMIKRSALSCHYLSCAFVLPLLVVLLLVTPIQKITQE